MKLPRIFQFLFGCRHRHLSRVFTIKHRTYRVCFDCGREFDLPDARVNRFPCISEGPCGKFHRALNRSRLFLSPHPKRDSLYVSYLAQTLQPHTCHSYLCSECVDGAAKLNRSSYRNVAGVRVLIGSRKPATSSDSVLFIRVPAVKPGGGTRFDPKEFSKIERREAPSADEGELARAT